MSEAACLVPCGDCHLCCELPWLIVNVYPDRGDDPADFDCYLKKRPTTGSGEIFVCKDEHGACVYLTPDGCGIYNRRPAVCRGFDCRNWRRAVPGRGPGKVWGDPDTVRALAAQGRRVARHTRQSLAARFNAILSARGG